METLHSKGYIHRDIKPDNFVVGLEDNTIIYMVDYWLSKPYLHNDNKRHIQFCEGKKLTGTTRYASVNAHLGYEQSRRDDLESLGYTLIFLRKGYLPWQGVPGKTKEERNENISKLKIAITPEKLCNGLPNAFTEYICYCKTLLFKEQPDYNYLKKLFRDCFLKLKLDGPFKFDWNRPKEFHRSDLVKENCHNDEKNNKPEEPNNIEEPKLIEIIKPKFEERKNNTSLFHNKYAAQLLTSDSNGAEINPEENNPLWDFASDRITEGSMFNNYIDNDIPVENPIRYSISVPLFKCSSNYNKMKSFRALSMRITWSINSRIKNIQKFNSSMKSCNKCN